MKLSGAINNRKKTALAITGICLLVLIVGFYVNSGNASRENSPFETALIQRGDLAIIISSTGSLAAKGTVDIGTQVSGTIDTISVDYNDQVKKGQILATLDQALFNAEVLSASASVASAQAALEQAQVEYDRNKPLNEKEYISDEEFLAYKTSLNTCKAALTSAKATLARAQTNLEYTIIRSPIDGTVIERSIEEGQTVAASLSTPTLFIIAEDLSQMQIEVDVDESDIGQIKVGQETEFEVAAYPDRKFSGAVEQIRLQPQTISNVVTYTVVVESQNDDGVLLPGMTATVDFMVNRQKDALLVPDSALKVSLGRPGRQQSDSSQNHDCIYVLENDQPPRRIHVKTGLSDGSKTVVNGENVVEGARVITSVKSGAKVRKRGLFSRLMPRPPGSGRGRGGR